MNASVFCFSIHEAFEQKSPKSRFTPRIAVPPLEFLKILLPPLCSLSPPFNCFQPVTRRKFTQGPPKRFVCPYSGRFAIPPGGLFFFFSPHSFLPPPPPPSSLLIFRSGEQVPISDSLGFFKTFVVQGTGTLGSEQCVFCPPLPTSMVLSCLLAPIYFVWAALTSPVFGLR